MDEGREGAIRGWMDRGVVMEDGWGNGGEERRTGGQRTWRERWIRASCSHPYLGVIIELAELLIGQDLIDGLLGHPVQPCQDGARLEFCPSLAGMRLLLLPRAPSQPGNPIRAAFNSFINSAPLCPHLPAGFQGPSTFPTTICRKMGKQMQGAPFAVLPYPGTWWPRRTPPPASP